jgi:hypothetical protein
VDKLKKLLVIAGVALLVVAVVVRVAKLKSVVFGTAWNEPVGGGTTV